MTHFFVFEKFQPLLNKTSTNVDKRCFKQVGRIETWPADVIIYVKVVSASKLEDILFAGPRWNVVSDRFRKAIEEFGAQKVQFLPVRVVDKTTDTDVGIYWVLHATQTLEALDIKHSLWLEPDKIHVLNLVHSALDREKAQNEDIFQLSISGELSNRPLISHRLKTYLNESGVTEGADFIEIPAY